MKTLYTITIYYEDLSTPKVYNDIPEKDLAEWEYELRRTNSAYMIEDQLTKRKDVDDQGSDPAGHES